MYTCAICQKTYKTRTSLTRHSHNHAEDANTHVCDCGLSFARKDILNRHIAKGHGGSEANSSRQRCHTACKACRAARIRCNGEHPCQSCSADGRACRYSSRSGRISKTVGRKNVTGRDGSKSQSRDSDDSSSSAMDADDTGLHTLTTEKSSTAYGPDPVMPAVSVPQDAQRSFDDTLMPDFNPGSYNMPVDLDGMSWPWLHESLFLQDDPFIGLFDGSEMPNTSVGSSGLQPSVRDMSQAPDHLQVPSGGNYAVFPASIAGADGTFDPMALLSKEIDNLVDWANKAASEAIPRSSRTERWRTAETKLANIMRLESSQKIGDKVGDQPILKQAIELYLREFNRLWPMFSEDGFDANCLHPILYLVLVSIGSMYGTPLHKHMGTLLHKQLRRLLAASLFDLEAPDNDTVWLAHARLLTQVQGLYFDQKQGFSYAQHLGATLVAQARRLNLFQNYRSSCATPTLGANPGKPNEKSKWKHAETRRRLAFGIFRADVYTSVLLNTRPLLAYDEIDLFLPHSNKLWHNSDHLPANDQALEIRLEERCRPHVFYSDLLRVFLDRHETTPEMGAIGYELCLFGLQLPIWKFSHDPDQFLRLTNARWQKSKLTSKGKSKSPDDAPDSLLVHSNPSLDGIESPSTQFRDSLGLSALINVDTLGQLHRRMQDLHQDRERVELALESWHAGFQAARRLPEFTQHRDSLMSSILLWHTSYLQLHAPLQKLHDISYRAAEARVTDPDTATAIREWAQLEDAAIATSRALSICDLMQQELARPSYRRACFNFLAFGGLHHAAVVLWAVSEVGSDACLGQASPGSALGGKLQVRDTSGLLQACARLFHEISPIGGCSSFGTAAERLAGTPFPVVRFA